MKIESVKIESVKMESASPASHMSPAIRKTSSAGLFKPDGKIPKKGIKRSALLL